MRRYTPWGTSTARTGSGAIHQRDDVGNLTRKWTIKAASKERATITVTAAGTFSSRRPSPAVPRSDASRPP